VAATYLQAPLRFEANRGQAHKDVRFLSRGLGYSLYLTADEAVLVIAGQEMDMKRDVRSRRAHAKPAVLQMGLVGAARRPVMSGLDELPGKANYFIGSDRTKWHTNVPTYAKVHYRGIYPGIDLVYYGNQRRLEYDFVVAPGADPKRIVLDFKGADKLEIDAQGELVLHTPGGDLRQHKPVIYQEIDGVRREIEGGYIRKGAKRVGFEVAAYDSGRPLVVDPALAYSTYLGGNSLDFGQGIAVDAAGNAYVAGITYSSDFPTTTGAFQPTVIGHPHAFVTKLDRTGSGLIYSTYLGGTRFDLGQGIAVDAAGNAYVTGYTDSTDFPTTAGAFQTTHGGITDNWDVFLTKLNPTGSALVYSTYLGGSDNDQGNGIAVDAAGNAYVTGWTNSLDFKTTLGAFQPIFGGLPAIGLSVTPIREIGGPDAFVTKFNPTGSALVYSTYLGGIKTDVGYGIAVDAAGNAYVTGQTGSALISERNVFMECPNGPQECAINNFPTTPGAFQTVPGGTTSPEDAFVTKLNPTGSALVYSTYLGGNGDDRGLGIALDSGNNAYVTGRTGSSTFPTTPGALRTTTTDFAYDAFVTKLNPTGSALIYSTLLGGRGDDRGLGIAVNPAGEAYVTGSTGAPSTPGVTASEFPISNAVQARFGGVVDAFVTKLDPTGTALVYSTFWGGSNFDTGNAIAVDADGNAYVTGQTSSTNFPTSPGAFQSAGDGVSFADAFVVKIFNAGTPPPPPPIPFP
jgi:hypothetical protein